jgi:asparagine synthase (glutamine-hydrolysing)
MCGILGSIGSEVLFKESDLGILAHRGPDSSAFFSDGEVFLGHTRLAIQDLSSAANQPMFSDDERFIMIFNGEIYNHWDIREDLVGKYQFKTSSDSETLLFGFMEYGSAVLSKLNGIFSFCIYDRTNKEVFIARDQLGVKPLYIYADEDKFLFSSELKAFIGFDIGKSIDVEALSNYITFLWNPGESTPLKKVKKLLPGHYLQFKIKEYSSVKAVKYYQIPFTGSYSQSSESQLIDQLETKLLTAVKRQMLSDVPVGFFLSGGLDSSLIVAMARKIFPDAELPCFTIDTVELASSEGFSDDLYYAKQVAEYLKVDLNVVQATIDIVKDFDKMIWHLDEPQADTAPLNVLNICTFARKKGIKVLLGGTAGDDLFSGYRRHQAINMEAVFDKVPKPLRSVITNFVNLLPGSSAAVRRARKVAKDLDKDTYARLSGYFQWLPYAEVFDLFTADWKLKLNKYNPSSNLVDLNQEIPDEKNLLNQVLYWEQKTFLVDHNLNYTDKLSMAVGMEVRVPFLDLELVDFATKIPPGLKLKGSETKYILKKVAERYLPHDVIYRPKTGFGAPVRKWVTEDLDEMINSYLSVEQLDKRGIFDARTVWNLIEKNKKGKIDASYSIWALLAIESWMRQFIDN